MCCENNIASQCIKTWGPKKEKTKTLPNKVQPFTRPSSPSLPPLTPPKKSPSTYSPSLESTHIRILQHAYFEGFNFSRTSQDLTLLRLFHKFAFTYGPWISHDSLRHAIIALTISRQIVPSTPAKLATELAAARNALRRKLNNPKDVDEGDLFTAFLLAQCYLDSGEEEATIHVQGFLTIMRHLFFAAGKTVCAYTLGMFWRTARDEILSTTATSSLPESCSMSDHVVLETLGILGFLYAPDYFVYRSALGLVDAGEKLELMELWYWFHAWAQVKQLRDWRESLQPTETEDWCHFGALGGQPFPDLQVALSGRSEELVLAMLEHLLGSVELGADVSMERIDAVSRLVNRVLLGHFVCRVEFGMGVGVMHEDRGSVEGHALAQFLVHLARIEKLIYECGLRIVAHVNDEDGLSFASMV